MKWQASVWHQMELSSLNNLNCRAHSLPAFSECVKVNHTFLLTRSVGPSALSLALTVCFDFLVIFFFSPSTFSIFCEFNWLWQCWKHTVCVWRTNVKWMKSKCSLNGNGMSHIMSSLSLFFLLYVLESCWLVRFTQNSWREYYQLEWFYFQNEFIVISMHKRMFRVNISLFVCQAYVQAPLQWRYHGKYNTIYIFKAECK